MDYTKQNRKEFRVKVLKDQLKTCLRQFHDKAQQWINTVKSITENSISAENQRIHPNQIMADLKQINYQRAYLEFKIQAAEKDRKLPLPMDLKQKMLKAELSVDFQKEFPQEYKIFTSQLKQKLSSKPYRPVQKIIKPKNAQKLKIPWRLEITDKIPSKKKPRKPSPAVSTIMRAIQSHERTFKDHRGYYQPPMFTKAKVEKMFSIYIPIKRFTKVKERLNSMAKRKKLGRAKSIKKARKGKLKIDIRQVTEFSFRTTIRRTRYLPRIKIFIYYFPNRTLS